MEVVVADGRISVVGVLRNDEVDGVDSVDDGSVVGNLGVHHLEVDAFLVDSVAAGRARVHLEDLDFRNVWVEEHVVLVSVVKLRDDLEADDVVRLEASLDASRLSLNRPPVHRQAVMLVLEVALRQVASVESVADFVVVDQSKVLGVVDGEVFPDEVLALLEVDVVSGNLLDC